MVGVPLIVIAAAVAASPAAGAAIAALILGVAAATAVYIKNRTYAHNSAIDRGEIAVAADPHFRPLTVGELPDQVMETLALDRIEPADIGRVRGFDGGWIVGRRNPRDVAVVVGEDGGWARFDPRRVTDLWAVTEYRGGRGREPS